MSKIKIRCSTSYKLAASELIVEAGDILELNSDGYIISYKRKDAVLWYGRKISNGAVDTYFEEIKIDEMINEIVGDAEKTKQIIKIIEDYT